MKKSETIILSFILLVYFLWFAIPVSLVGTADFRMIDAFNVDEAEFLQLLKTEVQSHEFNLRFYWYSHLYFNTGLVPLVIADFFGPVSEQTIIILFRLLSALFFAGTILLVFITGKNFFGKITAWISVILMLATSSQLYSYSAMLHPDTGQMFFITLSIFFCCRYFGKDGKKQWKFLAWAALASGLAFGTKYAGIMLMPIIAGIDLIKKPDQKNISPFKSWGALFFCLAGAVLLNKNWIIRYVPLNGSTENFYLLVEIARVLCFTVALMISVFIAFREKLIQKNHSLWIFEKLVNVVLLAAIFLTAFALSSPGCVRGLNFIIGFTSVTDLARYGHWFQASLGVKGWLGVLLSPGVLNIPVFVLFSANIALCIFHEIKYGTGKMVFSLVMLSWFIIYFSTLVLRINADFSHYLIPVIPFVIILASHSIEVLVNILSKKFYRVNSWVFSLAVPLIFLGFTTYKSSGKIIEQRESLVDKEKNAESVKAGYWIRENFSPDTKILYDRYAYVPYEFSQSFWSWGISDDQISETMPDLIVLNSRIYQYFSDPDIASTFLDGAVSYLKKYNCYKTLLEGNSDYKILKDFGSIKIFSLSEKREKEMFFSGTNDYEMIYEKWSSNNIVLDSVNSFSGKKAEKISGEYSSTFCCRLGDLFGDTMRHPVYVMAAMKAFLSEGSNAYLVIDFLRDEKSFSWQGKNFIDLVSQTNQWKEVYFSRLVPENSLPSDMVKIYVWNNSGKPVHMDDFRVEAFRYSL